MATPAKTNWRVVLAWIAFGSLLAIVLGSGRIVITYMSVVVGLAALWLLCVIFVIDRIAKFIGRN